MAAIDNSTVEDLAGIGDAIGWHPSSQNPDAFKAIKELLGSAGENFEEMMARTRLDDPQRSAIVMESQKALAIESLRKKELPTYKGAVKTQFEYSSMTAPMRAVHLRALSEIPGDGEARYEITSALTGGAFGKTGGTAKGIWSSIRGIGRRRSQEKLST